MAKSIYIFILLLGVSLSACDYIPSGNIDSIEIGDTVKVVTYETRYKTVYDTLFVELPAPNTKRQFFIDTLSSYLGVREATGNNDGEEIERFLNATCGFDNAPYCAAFVSYGLLQIDCPIPNLPCWTPSFFPKDKVVWKRGDKHGLVEGDVFGLYFKSKGRIAHVGIVIDDFGDGWCLTLEANTNSAGSREGDGVYKRLRHKSQLYKVSNWICQ